MDGAGLHNLYGSAEDHPLYTLSPKEGEERRALRRACRDRESMLRLVEIHLRLATAS